MGRNLAKACQLSVNFQDNRHNSLAPTSYLTISVLPSTDDGVLVSLPPPSIA